MWLVAVVAAALGAVGASVVARARRGARVDETMRAALAESSIGVALSTPDGRYLQVNRAFADLLGRTVDELLGSPFIDVRHPDDRPAINALWERLATGQRDHELVEARFVRPDGTEVWSRTNVSAVRDGAGRLQSFVSLHEDITALRQATATLAHRQAWFQALVAHSTDVICLIDSDGLVTYVSPSAANVLGYDPATRVGRPFIELVHPEDRDAAASGFRAATKADGSLPAVQLRIAHADGTWRHFETLATNLLADPDVGAVVTNSRDVTDKVEAAAQIEHRALHDPLTGLANRRLLVDRTEQAIQRSRRSGEPIGILFIDLDRFKAVNDRFGHSAGDRFLVVVAQRLLAAVRPGDTVARLGGDEFVVVADGATPGEAVSIAERVRATLAEPVVLPSGEHVISSASLGVVIGNGRSNVDALLRDADLALYSAKEHGRDRYELFEPALRKASVERLSTELLLRQALEQGDLVVLYEPVVELATGADVDVEARLRLQRPSGELVGPQEFLAVAEESGLILTIGAGVLDGACRQAMGWKVALGARAPGRVAVDTSVRQLAHPSFMAQVGRVLGGAGADPSVLALEVQEAGLRSAPPFVVEVLQQLRSLGVSIGLDGYGAGSASIAALAELPIDYVTLDRRLVTDLAHEESARAVARAVIDLARSLGRGTVAEGVTHPVELDVLRDLGCDRVQGPLLGEPLEAAALEHRFRGRLEHDLR